jgi:hypothetical protein
VEAYLAGATVYELAGRFGIHRNTVSSILERAGGPPPLQLADRATLIGPSGLYHEGDSPATIGQLFEIDPSTVRKALIEAGVRMRDTHGRQR